MPSKKAGGPSNAVADRLKECRRQLKAAKADALLLSFNVDYFYLTGFTGTESAVIVTPRDVHIISDGRFLEEIAVEVSWARAWIRKGVLNDEIVRACTELKIKKLAVQPGRFTVGDQAELQRRVRKMRIQLAPPITEKMRRLKSAEELAALDKAIRVAEDAFIATLKTIRVGQTELEMAARIEYEMKRRGASAPAFETICAEGANGAVPHAVPGMRKAKKGSAVLFDWGAKVAGYNSDLTRMVFVGSIPRKIGEIYRIVLDAQEAAVAAVQSGSRMCDVDAVARKIITDAGYGKEFTHGLGHGLGLEVHEAPSLSWRSDEQLVPGMVVTVEPGIYLPGVGGVRIEDDVLVTPKGNRVLTHLSKSLDAAVI
jgi:Xaa-Pro aminopeptidase